MRPQVECLHHEWIRDTLDHYYEASDRYIYVAHTNTGLIGLGEGGGPDTADLIEQCAPFPGLPLPLAEMGGARRYVGTNPFQWIGDDTSLALGTIPPAQSPHPTPPHCGTAATCR